MSIGRYFINYYSNIFNIVRIKMLINKVLDKKKIGRKNMAIWICDACGYEYNEDTEGTNFEDLPDDWTCPVCGVGKDMFTKQ